MATPEEINNLVKSIKNAQDENAVKSKLDFSRLSKAELNKLFIDALHKTGVTSTWKWDDVERALQNTPIWKSVKSFQEKKNLFNEYIQNYRTKEREEIKLRKEKLRQKFKKMLEEDKTINSDTKYAEIITKFSYNERWRSIEEKEREEMFQDYIDEIYKKEEKEFEEKRKKQKENLTQIFIQQNIPIDTKWKDINLLFKNNEDFNSMLKIDQLDAFRDYILDLEKKERIKRKEEEKYAQYQTREKFRDLLQAYLDEDKITMNTKWTAFVPEIQNKEEYRNLLLQPGSTPREIFLDLTNALKNDYKMNKKILKKILNENSLKFDSGISFEEYENILGQYEDYKLIRDGVKPVLYEHLIKKLKEKETEKNKREFKIAKKILKYMNKKKLNINENDNFSTVLKELRQFEKFDNVSDESLAKGFQLMKEKKKELAADDDSD